MMTPYQIASGVHKTHVGISKDALSASKIEAQQAEILITDLLQLACTKARQAMQERGVRNIDLANAIGCSPSALKKSTTNSFSMGTKMISDYCDILFPGQTIDFFLWGADRSMPLLHIDTAYLHIMEKLPKECRSVIQQMVTELPPGEDSPYARYWLLASDRAVNNPILDRFRPVQETQNLSKLTFVPTNGKDLHVRSLMQACVYCETSLEYLLRQDYARGTFTIIEGGKSVPLSLRQKCLLRKFSGLSMADKSSVVAAAAMFLR